MSEPPTRPAPGSARREQPGTIDAGKQARARAGLPIVPALDGFRAAAIFAIVFLHLITAFVSPTDDLGAILTLGLLSPGVDALFILSGFVVFLPTVARNGEFGPVIPYAIRRAARLLPAYWLAIGLVLIMLATWPTGAETPPASQVGWHLIGLHAPAFMVDPGFSLGLGIDGPLWTLSLEVTFYLLLPLVAAAYYRHPFAGLAIAAAVTIAWKLGGQHAGAIADALGIDATGAQAARIERASLSQFPAFAVQFALGMTAAWLFVELPKRLDPARLRSAAAAMQAISGLAFVGFAILLGDFMKSGDLITLVIARGEILLSLGAALSIAAFMLATSLAPSRRQLPFALPAARSLGDISYGVYLIHLPLILLWISFVDRFAPGSSGLLTGFFVAAPLLLVASISYGYLSARLLEQPIRRWAHRFGYRGRAAREQAPTAAG